MRLTLLVVSRTPTLLSRMLPSVAAATAAYQEVEILCSWKQYRGRIANNQ